MRELLPAIVCWAGLLAMNLSLAAQVPADDLASLQQQAGAGDAQAEFALGNRYFRGLGVPQNYGQALDWYHKSAAQSFAPAQNQLGAMYQHNLGVPHDYRLAAKYYESAAKQGYAPAECNLAGMFESGLSVKHDLKQAFQWYSKAAEQNYADAEEELGYFYQNGYGVKRDYAQSLVWYQRAAAHGSVNAENQLGMLAENGWGEPQDYALALSWFSKAAAAGSDTAAENIGYMYQYGSGIPKDYAQARGWYYEAADQGNGDAENQIGWMYQFGQGVEQNDAEALAWYRLAAENGNVPGRNNLHVLIEQLKDAGGGVWSSAEAAQVRDPELDRAQNWKDIRDLRAQIMGLEADAVQQDQLAEQLESMGKGKTDVVSKNFYFARQRRGGEVSSGGGEVSRRSGAPAPAIGSAGESNRPHAPGLARHFSSDSAPFRSADGPERKAQLDCHKISGCFGGVGRRPLSEDPDDGFVGQQREYPFRAEPSRAQDR